MIEVKEGIKADLFEFPQAAAATPPAFESPVHGPRKVGSDPMRVFRVLVAFDFRLGMDAGCKFPKE